jgi:hypothetical protein
MLNLDLDLDRMSIKDGKLIINSFRSEDSADYECIFIYETKTNEYKIILDNKKFRFIARKLKLSERIISEIEQIGLNSFNVLAGITLEISCNFGNKEYTNEINWRKLDVLLE